MDDSRPPQHPPALRGEERAHDADPSRPPRDEPPRDDAPRAPRGPSEFATKLWKRLTRTARGAAGVAVLAAALLLWPFSDWAVIPWLAGIATLVLLALLRVDRLLRGWVWHVGGLVVVGGLMWSTSPWAWFLAASIGVLIAGVIRLPAWRLAAVGAVLCLVSGTAFGIANYRTAQQLAEQDRVASEASFSLAGERNPQRVLPALLEGIGQRDVTAVCGLLDDSARAAFTAAADAPDCPAAVAAYAGASGTAPVYDDLPATTAEAGPGIWITDGCDTVWADSPLGGPELGRIEIRQSDPPGRTYFLAEFLPCSAAPPSS